MTKMPLLFTRGPPPDMTGPAKRQEVASLLDRLRTDLSEKNLFPPQRNELLEHLKILCRQPEDAELLFTKEGIETLTRHSFDSNSPTTSREALRCLANALVLEPSTRQIFVDLGCAPKAVDRLKNDNRDDEFLISRILFLTTYNTNIDFEKLIDEDHLADHLNTNVARHARVFSKESRKASAVVPDDAALSETLKLIFNITHYYPSRADVFAKSIPNILKILARRRILDPPLQQPVNYLINALLNLDLEDRKAVHFGFSPVFPKFDQKCNVERLVAILDKAVGHEESDEELEQVAAPLVTLLRRIYDFAPEGVKRYMQRTIMPSDDERAKPLGTTNTLPSRLLRLSTSPLAPALRENLSSLFFELSDKDATSFVHNVGYGFASGFLMSHDLPIPENALEAWSSNGGGGGGADGADSAPEPINPITGQRRSAEVPDRRAPMTMEEKEREAERLFVLFERLKRTGVVDMKHPVAEALHQGRLQELDDDDDDDGDGGDALKD
ncbi:MAG: hypothetical protein M1826_000088 [Phylliscum demangeonii]|nr:MAG: hypothetical protein M1826_000088 [Phylliscum demangeonii]